MNINVGWVTKPELGTIECEVIDHWLDGTMRQPLTVRCNKGKAARVSWCHSQERYVFVPKSWRKRMRKAFSHD